MLWTEYNRVQIQFQTLVLEGGATRGSAKVGADRLAKTHEPKGQ